MALAGIASLVCGCGSSVDDPASAACPRPPATIGAPRTSGDHLEAAVHFTCSGSRLAGTLYLPPSTGRHAAVVWLHGSGEEPRLSYGPLVASYVGDGIAFFSYDKRGVGESEGKCCPDVYGHFNLVTADAVGAVAAVRRSPQIDPNRVGFLGASAAGWVAPRAAEASKHVAFLALASPGVLQHSIVANFEQFAGGSESTKPRPSEAAIAKKFAEWKRDASGFDPRPYRNALTLPRSGSSEEVTGTSHRCRALPHYAHSNANAARTGRSSSFPAPVTGSSTVRRRTRAPLHSRRLGSAATFAAEASN